MGVVYRARDTKLDRTVALKFLPSHLGADESEKQRFLHEAKSASALDHTNICSIHSIEETDDGNLFIVMAYYEGVSLKEKIEQGPLPLKDVINYAHQIASGLQKAHEKGVVHRDLKPANIFITNDNQVKIIDFGLAKAAQRTMLTKSGTTLGTVPYMSPEQAQSSTIDHRTDIWSLGVVMYEMITGQLPFKSEYETALVYSIINEDPEPVTGLRSGVPMELERILNKCLEKESDDRYQHTNEIIVDLRKVDKDISSGIRTNISKSTGQKDRAVAAGDQPALVQKIHVLYGIPVLLLLLIGVLFFLPDRMVISEVDGSIAVLPFESLSPDPANDYFTAGIHEDIIIQLAKIDDITVIGRSSVIGYQPGERDYRTIGTELGVSTLLEGSVRRDADRVRVSINLIDAETHRTLWAERYDRDLTDLFFIQADIAEEISQSLQASLSPREKESIAHVPTHSTQAYDLYLQGREYMRRDYYNPDDFRIAIDLYERAIEADPEFALAYAELSTVHLSMYWLAFDQTEERLQKSQTALEQALKLDPDNPIVRMANGIFYYNAYRDYDRALEELTFAMEQIPNYDEVYFYAGAVQRRMGLWDDAKRSFQRALELDPRNFVRLYEMVMTYQALREYSNVEKVIEQADLFFPDSESVKQMKYAFQTRIGKPQYTRENVLELFPDAFKENSIGVWFLYLIRDFDFIVENVKETQGYAVDAQRWYFPKSMIVGLAHKKLGDDRKAQAYFDTSRVHLETLREERPDDPRIRSSLGRVYGKLGMKEEAIREGKKAMELLPIEQDAMAGSDYEIEMAKIYTIIGEHDRALDYIERLLSIPADFISSGLLLVDPDWDPLRDDPRFQEIIGEG